MGDMKLFIAIALIVAVSAMPNFNERQAKQLGTNAQRKLQQKLQDAADQNGVGIDVNAKVQEAQSAVEALIEQYKQTHLSNKPQEALLTNLTEKPGLSAHKPLQTLSISVTKQLTLLNNKVCNNVKLQETVTNKLVALSNNTVVKLSNKPTTWSDKVNNR